MEYCQFSFHFLFHSDGKGRGTKSLTAITSFASLMFISTLGKDPSNKTNCDDMYGELIRDILGDEDEEEDDTDMDKTTTDISNDKVAISIDSLNKNSTESTAFKCYDMRYEYI
jgi:hypothetical protein